MALGWLMSSWLFVGGIGCSGTDNSAEIMEAEKALAQPEQEPNKDGSLCPEFWDWLPKAYNFDGNGAFTKYNMEVAFLAGKQTSQPAQQEPVAITITGKLGNIYSFTGDYSLKKGDKVYTTPPQRTWVGLTDEEIILIVADCASSHQHTDIHFARAIEAKLKEKNT